MSLAIPYTFIGGVGRKARASEVNANFQAVAAKFTEGAGGIADGDISTVAGIKGTKISNIAGLRIPTDRIEDDAIDKDKLRDDTTTPGRVNAAVNTADHIRDGIITKAKMLAATLTKAQLAVTEVTQAFTLTTVGSVTGTVKVAAAPALPAMSTIMPLSLRLEGVASTAAIWGAVVGIAQDSVGTPYFVVTGYGSSGATPVMTGTIRFTYLALT